MNNQTDINLIYNFLLKSKKRWSQFCKSFDVNGDEIVKRLSKDGCIEIPNPSKKEGLKCKPLLSQDLVERLFTYDPASGLLKWKKGKNEGMVAGYGDSGEYRRVRILGYIFMVHRVIWLLVYGSDSDLLIDHINGNKSDNRIENLRLANHSQNGRNSNIQKRNTSGYKGVTKYKIAWVVRVNVNGENVYFGSYQDVELAGLVSEEARVKYHGEFAKTQNI
ncbi:HNH endonuclease [Enterobacter hormaechei]|uniref:HNH endonuclease n=1 Tax=Enterobacter hormaechei TaxID=158836 RepID=UPI001D07F168|nr:HNH endonuclease [Enterobacter hormaechei]